MSTNRDGRFVRQLVRYGAQGAALTAVILVLALLGTVRQETWEQLRAFPVGLWALLPLMVGASWMSNGGRVWLLSRSLGYRLRYRQALAVSMSQEFGIAASPGGLGGTALRVTLLHRAGVPVSQSSTMLAADVFLDGLFFGCITLGAIGVVVLNPGWRDVLRALPSVSGDRLLWLLPPLPAVLLACLLVRRKWRAATAGLARTRYGRRFRIGARLRLGSKRLRAGAGRSWRAARFLFGRRRLYLAGDFLFTAVQWSCRYGVLPVVLFGCGVELNPLPIMILQGLLFMTSLVLVLPGGGGGIELLSVLILPVLVPTALAGVVVLVWRFFTYHLYLLVGGAVCFWTIRHLDRIFPGDKAKAATLGRGLRNNGLDPKVPVGQ